MASFALNPLTESSVPGVGSAPAGSAPRIQEQAGGVASLVTGLASIAAKALPAFEQMAKDQKQTDLVKDVKEFAMISRGWQEGVDQGSVSKLQMEVDERARANKGFEKYGSEEYSKEYSRQTGRKFDFVVTASTQQTVDNENMAVGFKIMGRTDEPERAKEIGASYNQNALEVETRTKALTLSQARTSADLATKDAEGTILGMSLVDSLVQTVDQPLIALLTNSSDALKRGDYKTLGDIPGLATAVANIANEGRSSLHQKLANSGVSLTTRDKIVKHYDDRVSGVKDVILGGGKALEENLKILKTKAGLDLSQSAPLVFSMLNAGIGEQAAAGFLNGILTKPDTQITVTNEIEAAMRLATGASKPKGTVSPSDLISAIKQPNLTSAQLPENAEALFRGSLGGLAGALKEPGSERNGLSVAKLATSVSNYALLGTVSNEGLGNIVSQNLGNGEVLSRLTELSKVSPGMADVARGAAQKIVAVAVKSIRADGKEPSIMLQPEGGLSVGAEMGAVGATAGLIRYDPGQGRFVATEESGAPASPSRVVDPAPLDRMNRALDATVRFSALDPSASKLGDKGMREMVVQAVWGTLGKEPLVSGSKFETAQTEGGPKVEADSNKAAMVPVPFETGTPGAQKIIDQSREVMRTMGQRQPAPISPPLPVPKTEEAAEKKALKPGSVRRVVKQ